MWNRFLLCFIAIMFVGVLGFWQPVYAVGPGISGVTDNRASYGGQVPTYEKFEITFSVNTSAKNLYFPYDQNAPVGITPVEGISVEGLFTRDNWQTTYSQPAFYYQDFDVLQKGTKDWLYPKSQYFWKVRFAPNKAGNWQYKLKAQDASGTTETQAVAFTVSASSNKGFIRVSKQDLRYFEFEDGTYFPGLGYNMNFDQVSWRNPVQDNLVNFQKMSQNGIQFIRIWLSQWTIFANAWSPWRQFPGSSYGYVPLDGVNFSEHYPGHDLSLGITSGSVPCVAWDDLKGRPALKQGSKYQVQVRVKQAGLIASNSAKPFGFVVKTGGWLWDSKSMPNPTLRCDYPGTGSVIAATYPGANWTITPDSAPGWVTIKGTLDTNNRAMMYSQDDFLPNFYLALENTTSGSVYVDEVLMQEELGGGQLGPNVISKETMDEHTYMDQRQSIAFDKVLDLAHQHGVYLRPALLEKNDWIWRHINFDGGWIPGTDPKCFDSDSNNDPIYPSGNSQGYHACPVPDPYFYGDLRNTWKVRWLQQAYFRYIQARYGYSTNIHSWELLNEGDPFVQNTGGRSHFAQTDEFGKYMQCTVFGVSVGSGDGQKCQNDNPNHHLTSTSFWSGFPKADFWANTKFPNVDFGDVHEYIPKDKYPGRFYDTASASGDAKYRILDTLGNVIKPSIRGETGFTNSGSEPESADLYPDTTGVWLHNFLWGQMDNLGMLDSGNWYPNKHIYYSYNGQNIDNRPIFKSYYDFVRTIPLNKGGFSETSASANSPDLRAWGQKDVLNKRAYLWIANKKHTWKNVVDGVNISPISDTVKVGGFVPGQSYKTEWWDTYTGTVSKVENRSSNPQGEISLPIVNLTTDVAVKIGDFTGLGPSVGNGDANNDASVNALDLKAVLAGYLKTVTAFLNQYSLDQKINAFDFVMVLKRLP